MILSVGVRIVSPGYRCAPCTGVGHHRWYARVPLQRRRPVPALRPACHRPEQDHGRDAGAPVRQATRSDPLPGGQRLAPQLPSSGAAAGLAVLRTHSRGPDVRFGAPGTVVVAGAGPLERLTVEYPDLVAASDVLPGHLVETGYRSGLLDDEVAPGFPPPGPCARPA